MLREMIIVAAFVFALSAIVSGFVIVQKSAVKQLVKVENVLEKANEIN